MSFYHLFYYFFVCRELTDYTSNIIASSAYPQVKLEGISRNRVILEDLAIAKNYEIVVIPFNSQGLGPASRPVSVYVGEAVPTGAPQNVRCQPVSPTEVRLTWNAPQADQQNGKYRWNKSNNFFFQNWSKLVQTCLNLSEIVQIRSRFILTEVRLTWNTP